MAGWLKRTVAWLALDAAIIAALLVPNAGQYLRWPLLAVYAALSWLLYREVKRSGWLFRILRDTRTRMS